MPHIIRLYPLIVLVLLLLPSCKEDETETSIGEYPVFLKTSYSEYQTLRTPNQCVVYPADRVYSTNFQLGYGGICLFRDIDNHLGCVDLACPYENLRTTTVVVKMPTASCPICGSQFDLTYGLGNVTKGPSTKRLKTYSKIVDYGDHIKVSN